MKKQIAGFAAVLSVVALQPMTASARTLECANGQDAYSSTLRAMGTERLAWARSILDNMLNPPPQQPAVTNTIFQKAGHAVAQLDRRIPVSVLNHAQCVVILPHQINIGAGLLPVGYQYGTGVSFCRGKYGIFDEGHFVKLEGASYGPQIGLEHSEQVLLFTNRSAVDHMEHASIKLGADVSVSVGNVGRDAQVDTNINLGDRVIAYSHSKGVYAGAALRGGVLRPDTKMQQAFLGQRVHRNFWEKIRHSVARLLGEKADSCQQVINAATASSEMAAAVNPAAEPMQLSAVCQSAEKVAPAQAAAVDPLAPLPAAPAAAHFSGPAE